MPTQNTHPTFWTRWKRGFSALWRAYFVFLAAYCLFYLPVAVIAGLSDVIAQPAMGILGIIFFLGWIVIFVVFLPVVVSRLNMDPASIREELAIELEPQIDAIGRTLGVRWEEHYLFEVGELLKNDKSVDARRVYREHSHTTWDEVDQALANWRMTVMKDKLKAIQEAADAPPGPATGHTA